MGSHKVLNFDLLRATTKDHFGIKALILEALKNDTQAFTVSYNEYATSSEDWWNRYLYNFTQNIFTDFYVLKNVDSVIGMVGVMYNPKVKTMHTCTIIWFYILAEYRGKGVGTIMLNKVIEDVKKRKEIKKISLTVTSTQTKAMEIYKKAGFEVAGIQKRELFVNNEYIDFVLMEKFI